MTGGDNDDTGARASVAEEQFRLLVESVRDYAIFMLDPGGRVATWNAGARNIKGYAPEEIIGSHISDFYTPEDRAAGKPQQLLDAAAAEGRAEDEGWRLRRDGGRFWADVVITALRDPTGRLVGFAKVTRDLTGRREAEERLRQTEARLAATLYSIGDGVLATDQDGRITMINRVAQGLTGWSEEDAKGRPVDEVFHIINETTRARVECPVARVLKEGVIVGLANHTALIARDGVERPIADSGAPIKDLQGVTRGSVLVFRDVTVERQAEEALRQGEERLRLMVASVYDYAIFMLDPTGNVVSWNPGAERMKGYRQEEIIGRHFSCFFDSQDVAQGKPEHELQIAARDGRFEDEAWRVRKDGSRFWANIVMSAVRNASGRLVGFTKVTRDLTDQRRLQEERVRLAQAQEAVRLKDEFLSIASHELKTPLTAMQLQLQGLRSRIAVVDEQLATRLEKAVAAGDRLAHLIETLLDASRIATLALKIERCDLVDTVRQVLERSREALARAGCNLSLSTNGPVPGVWDHLRVEQIVTNLLSNAIKYAGGAPLDVVVERAGEEALLEVSDRGPGIGESDLERIFGKFERASATAYGGMGLGLYIARQIAQAHGGSITASNRQGGGACFTVRLPLTPSIPKP
jgi:PAS domain S-box-containing protein